MKKYNLKFQLLFFILLYTLSFNCLSKNTDNYFSYLPIFESSSSFIIDKNEKKIHLHALTFNIIFCKSTDDFYCIKSEHFNFSVPKKISFTENQKWIFDKDSYFSKTIKNVEIFGNIFKLVEIKQNENFLFYFSPKNGLIGFKSLKEKDSPLFILSQKCGFAASKNCNRNKFSDEN